MGYTTLQFLYYSNVTVMKKIFILLVSLFLIILQANSQCFFNKIYDTYSGVFNAGHGAIQTLDGGYIVIGESAITQTTDGTYILKVNACGDTLWQKIYDLSLGDLGYSIVQLSDSSYVICGAMYNSIEGASDAFLLKLDKNGDSLWLKPINAGYNDGGRMHKQTPDGGFIIGGYFNVANGKVFLVKTDNEGNVQWQHNYAVDSLENYLLSVDITADNGFILGGTYVKNSDQKFHLFLIKTDSLGIKKWAKSYGSVEEAGGKAISTLDNGFIQVGYRYYSAQSNSRYIIKTDSNGIIKWQKLFSWPNNSDVFKVIRQLPDSSYIVGGSIADTIHSNNLPRILLMKFNKQGDSLWAKTYTYYGGAYQFGSVAHDYLEDLNLTSDGGFIICGYIINNYMPGQNDLLLIKTDSLGNTCQIDTITYVGCSYQECNYTQAIFTVSTDTIDLHFTDTIHFFDQSIFAQHWFWDFGDGQTDTTQNPLHVFDTTGTYNVMMFVSFNNCSDTAYNTVVVINSVGMQPLLDALISNFYIFPNPAKESVTINLVEYEPAEIIIYNMHGVVMLTQQTSEKKTVLNISSLEKGVYTVKVQTGKGLAVRKLMKE